MHFEEINKSIRQFENISVFLIGDLMLDRHFFWIISRTEWMIDLQGLFGIRDRVQKFVAGFEERHPSIW